MTKTHLAAAAVFGVVLPGYSWLDGSGWLAWTMFSKSETYRLRVVVMDAAEQAHVVNPTALGALVDEQVALYLSGAEHYRQAPIGAALAANLSSLAKVACRLVPRAARSRVSLDIRKNLDALPRTTTEEVSCP